MKILAFKNDVMWDHDKISHFTLFLPKMWKKANIVCLIFNTEIVIEKSELNVDQ